MKSWKTTTFGVMMFLAGVFALKKSLLPAWSAGDFEMIAPAVGLVLGGLGLIFARDNNVSSEQVGLKPDAAASAVAEKLKGVTFRGLPMLAMFLKPAVVGLGLVVLSGCANQTYVKEAFDKDTGKRIALERYRGNYIYQTSALKGLKVGSETKTGKTGLSIAGQENDTDEGAIEATGVLLERAVSAAVATGIAAGKKTVVPFAQ